MRKQGNSEDAPRGKLTVIEDFLPPPIPVGKESGYSKNHVGIYPFQHRLPQKSSQEGERLNAFAAFA